MTFRRQYHVNTFCVMFSCSSFIFAPGIPPSKMLSEASTRTNSSGLTSPPPWSEHTQKYLKLLCAHADLYVIRVAEKHVGLCTSLTNTRKHLSVSFFTSIGNKTGAMSSGYRPVRNTRSGTGLDKKKTDSR